ncbi:hypothetical protein T11_13898 [Trichinella zimbabwensis]|uniref:Uncharacterized protein n=1 Tax=Trichinella zimbabwensis TaxID=268475 RepID=A0A0V1I565_9BILA|nr:hypothetical protein T11_13898 [Trichinella zimbabwensis]
MWEITKFRLKMKLFLCVLAITLCATSGFKFFKTKKEQITRTPLKYDQGKAESLIQELCSVVCSQYSEEYLKLTKEQESVNDADAQKAKAEYVTCSLRCTTSIKAELRSLDSSGFQFKAKKGKAIQTPLKYDQEKVESQIQELCSTVCNQYSEEYLQLEKELDSVNEVELQTVKSEYVTCLLRCTSSIEAELRLLE